MIFQTFDSLAPGDAFILVNDDEPRPLYCQFLHKRTDQFTWSCLEQGPKAWRVKVERTAK